MPVDSYASVGHGSGIFLPVDGTGNVARIMCSIDPDVVHVAEIGKPPCDHAVPGLRVLDCDVWDLFAPLGRLLRVLDCYVWDLSAPLGRLRVVVLTSVPREQCRDPPCGCVATVVMFVWFLVF